MKKLKLNLVTLAGILVALALSVTGCEDDMNLSDVISDEYTLDNRGYDPDDVNGQETQNHQRVELCTCLNDQFEKGSLEENEAVALLYMREEEKLARDVYSFLYKKWNYKIFENIAKSEDRHMSAVGCLIERYGLDDPIDEDIEGKFFDTDLQALYLALIDQGSASLGEALFVGATIEDLDIADLLAHLEDEEIDNDDIRAVFGELLKGSRNHMRAFVRNLNNQSLSYTPVYITDEYFEEIINTDREKGGSICEGINECQGQGNQNGNQGNGNCDGSGQGNQNGNQGNGNCDGSGQGNQNGNQGNGNCDGSGQGNQNGNQGNQNTNGNNGGNGNSGNNGGN